MIESAYVEAMDIKSQLNGVVLIGAYEETSSGIRKTRKRRAGGTISEIQTFWEQFIVEKPDLSWASGKVLRKG